MKKTIKLSFAALALATLASCSGDDLLGKGSNPLQQNNKKGVVVEVEDMIDPLTTRSAFTVNDDGSGHLLWQGGDQLWVFDGTLTMYDKYFYNAEEGEWQAKDGDDAVPNPQLVLFQYNGDEEKNYDGDMHDFHWVYDTKTSEVSYTIPSEWKWGEVADLDADGKMAYLSNVPLWGTATVDEEKGLKIGLRYLTALMHVSLGNVPGNATSFIVEAYSDVAGNSKAQITGDFTAVLATKAVADNDAALKATLKDGAESENNNTIKVDLSGAKFEKTDLYIPMIARDYGLLRLYYTTDAAQTEKVHIGDMMQRPYERGQLYNVNVKAFDVAGNDIPALNRALEVNKDQDEFTIKTSKKTTVASDKTENNTIVIPAGTTAKSITLDLLGFEGSKQVLSIVAEEDYTGKLILQVPEDAALNNIISNVYVNLPNAEVTFAGNWANVDLGKKDTANSLIVKTLNIAANAVVKGIYPNAVCCQNNTDTSADIMIAAGSDDNASTTKVTTLQLPDNTSIDNITISDKVTNVYATPKNTSNNEPIAVTVKVTSKANIGVLNTNQSAITVSKGTTVGTLNMKNGGTVNVQGKVTTLNGNEEGDKKQVTTLSISGADANNGHVGTANVPGANVTVAKTAYVNAINQLNMGDNKKLTLTGGIIITLNSGTNLTFSNTEKYPTSITNISEGVEINDYVSTWCGTAHTANITPTKVTTEGTTTKYVITTASQFVKWAGNTSGGVTLGADIDLNDLAFTPNAAVSVSFDGNYKTVSKVSITSAVATGLFKSLATNAEVKNLLINGIGINQTSAGTFASPIAVGALAGTAAGGKIDNVNVKYATLMSESWAVGGLVGSVTGNLTITGKSTKDDFGGETYSTVEVEIEGQNKLGGLVGQIASGGSLTISNYKPVATFDVNEKLDGVRNKTNFGTVAPFVGTALSGATSLTVTETNASKVADLTYAQRGTWKYDNNYTTKYDEQTEVMSKYLFVGRTHIGYVSAEGFNLDNTSYGSSSSNLTENVTKKTDATKYLNAYLLQSAYTD